MKQLAEKTCVECWNKNHVDFQWQIAFKTPLLTKKGNISRYIIDAYLPRENLYVEIKGYMRPDAHSKWEWFHENYPNSELWDHNKIKQIVKEETNWVEELI